MTSSLRVIDFALIIALFALLFAMFAVSHRGATVGSAETSVGHRLDVLQERQHLLQEAIQNMTTDVAAVYASLEEMERLLQETTEKQNVVSAVRGEKMKTLFANSRKSLQAEMDLIVNSVEYSRDRG